MPIIKNCIFCSKEFKTKLSHASRRKYCSRECHNNYSSRRSIKLSLHCITCDKEFKYYPSEGDRKYCSKICAGSNNMNVKYNCAICDFECYRKPSKVNAKYCSINCRIVGHSKETEFWLFSTHEQKIERLKISYEKFVIKNPEGCWDWSGCKTKQGYPVVGFGKGTTIKGNRASWMIHYGEIPDGKWILHHCDFPPCTKIVGDPTKDHLYLGTAKDNSRDAKERGRLPIRSGERHPRALLTNEQVKEVKELLKNNIPVKIIGKKYNVKNYIIYNIRTGKTYKKLNE